MANFKRAAKRRKYSSKYKSRRNGNTIVSDISIMRGKMRDFHQVEKKKHDMEKQLWETVIAPEDDNTMIFAEITSDGLASSQARHVTLLNEIDQSMGYEGRIGRQVFNKHITIRGTIFPRRVSDTANRACTDQATCRVILVEDKCPNGNRMSLEEFLIPTSNGAIDVFNANAMINLNYRERFKVHWDKTFILGAKGSAASDATVPYANGVHNIVFKKFKRLNRRTTYLGTEAPAPFTDIGITKTAFYLVTLGDAQLQEATGVYSNGGQLVFTSRIRYSDS